MRLLDIFDKENTVSWMPDHFHRGIADTEWLRRAAEMSPKPVILSGDGRILRNKVERQCLKDGDFTYVCLAKGWTSTSWSDYAWKIIKAWPAVVEEVQACRQPTVFELHVGKLKVERKSLTREL